MSQIKCKNKYI